MYLAYFHLYYVSVEVARPLAMIKSLGVLYTVGKHFKSCYHTKVVSCLVNCGLN